MDTSPQVQMNTTAALNEIHVTSAKKIGNQAKKVSLLREFNFLKIDFKLKFCLFKGGSRISAKRNIKLSN
jgi:hypothetical protein